MDLLDADVNRGLVTKAGGWLRPAVTSYTTVPSIPGMIPSEAFAAFETEWLCKQSAADFDADNDTLREVFGLTLHPAAPTITTDLVDQTVVEGQSATFTVAVSGTGPFQYVWEMNGSPILVAGGSLSGNGTISGSVTNSGQCSPGASPGTLTTDGNYTQLPTAVLNIEIGGLTPGSQFDRLIVTGTATLNGTLRVTRVNGFQPGAGHSFQVMTIASRSCTFSNLTGSTINEDLAFTGTATNTSYTLTATATPFQQWKTTQLGANADPEGDGIANWLEDAFGLHPLQAKVTQLPTAALQTTGGSTYLTRSTANGSARRRWTTTWACRTTCRRGIGPRARSSNSARPWRRETA